MKTLAGSKGRPEQAFKRWENTHCGPDVKAMLVKLNKQHRIEEDVSKAKQAERMNAALEREAELSELATQKEMEIAKVVEEQTQIAEERQKLVAKEQRWLIQRGGELSKAKSKEALKGWFGEEIDRIKPVMLAEAKRIVGTGLKQSWEKEKMSILSTTKEEGRKLGYQQGLQDGIARGKETGYTESRRAVLAEMNAKIAQAKAEQCAEGYRKGHVAGHADGKAEGHEDGRTEGYAEGSAVGMDEGHTNGYTQGDANGRAMGSTEGYEKGYAVGHSQGHQKGRAKGKAEGYQDGHEIGYEEGHNDVVDKGHTAGHEEGHTEGLEKGRRKGFAKGHKAGLRKGSEQAETKLQMARKQSEYLGFHKAMLMCSSDIDQKLPDSVKDEEDSYWWGRALAWFIQRHRL